MKQLQNNQFETLKEHFKKGTHGHAYLFFGGSREKMREAALECAEIVSGHGRDSVNPDILLIELAEGEEKIFISQARAIQRFLSLEPYFAKGKAVIIDGIERMGEHASSALLKALEEPFAHSVFILISEQPGIIMPTILSRVQKIRFFEGPQKGIDNRKEMYYTLSVIIHADIAERLAIAERLSKDDSPASEQLLSHWVSFYRDLSVLAVEGEEEFVENQFFLSEMKEVLKKARYSPARIGTILSEMVRLDFALRTTSVNRRLALENIMLLL
ncbi:hypothetical protein HY250_04020 [Candidatus Azambacteria bacterium]|nr:hypothetical protein [Candidatus Azambacteria bacterium]MBI3685543.1 hypothetical protein [Candidatus Azambacteria bacterium]